eukprot:1193100-Prorocentrum_minimum.AAC.2
MQNPKARGSQHPTSDMSDRSGHVVSGRQVPLRYAGEVKTPKGLSSQHRLQTANRVVPYVNSGYRVRLIAPVTNDSDVQESQKLGSVCRDARSGAQDSSILGPLSTPRAGAPKKSAACLRAVSCAHSSSSSVVSTRREGASAEETSAASITAVMDDSENRHRAMPPYDLQRANRRPREATYPWRTVVPVRRRVRGARRRFEGGGAAVLFVPSAGAVYVSPDLRRLTYQKQIKRKMCGTLFPLAHGSRCRE